jgi:hypothetical protein
LVRIPADVDREDPLLVGLSARQLAILAGGALVVWGLCAAAHEAVSPPVLAGLATPIAVAAAALALGHRHGVSADRLAVAAVRQGIEPKRLVVAPEGLDSPPAWIASPRGLQAAPQRLPVGAITSDGVIDLRSEGAAMLCRASSLTFSLRTEREQEALVAAFGRVLNGVDCALQILVRTQPLDLTEMISDLREAAGGMPHPGLEAAAREHARFLAELTAAGDVLCREVVVVLRATGAGDAGDRLRRSVEVASASLSVAGISTAPLQGDEASAVVVAAMDPEAPPRPRDLATESAIITRAPG